MMTLTLQRPDRHGLELELLKKSTATNAGKCVCVSTSPQLREEGPKEYCVVRQTQFAIPFALLPRKLAGKFVFDFFQSTSSTCMHCK